MKYGYTMVSLWLNSWEKHWTPGAFIWLWGYFAFLEAPTGNNINSEFNMSWGLKVKLWFDEDLCNVIPWPTVGGATNNRNVASSRRGPLWCGYVHRYRSMFHESKVFKSDVSPVETYHFTNQTGDQNEATKDVSNTSRGTVRCLVGQWWWSIGLWGYPIFRKIHDGILMDLVNVGDSSEYEIQLMSTLD